MEMELIKDFDYTYAGCRLDKVVKRIKKKNLKCGQIMKTLIRTARKHAMYNHDLLFDHASEEEHMNKEQMKTKYG